MTIAAGSVSVLLGANGAGKSSLVVTIAGVLPAKAGTVRVGDTPLLGLGPHAVRSKGVAVVAEGHQVLTGLSVLDNLRAAGLALPRAETDREVEAALETSSRAEAAPGGRCQGALGRPEADGQHRAGADCEAAYLLIDELSFGLAPAIVVRLGEVIRTVAARGVGILLSEQFTTLALSLASRAFVMERGNLVFSGTSAELHAKPEILHGAYLASGAQ